MFSLRQKTLINQLKIITVMKKIASMAVMLLLVCLVASCVPATPSRITAQSIEYIKAGDYESYINTFDMNSEEKAQYRDLFEKKGVKSIEEKGGILDYEIVSETITENGTKATVEALVTYGGGDKETSKFYFVKVGEEWKQVLNK